MSLIIPATKADLRDTLTERQIIEILAEVYPRHSWHVECRGGLARIRCLSLSGAYGVVLKTPPIYSASSLKHDVVIAAGELLERYFQPRGAADMGRLANAPRDLRGNLLADMA